MKSVSSSGMIQKHNVRYLASTEVQDNAAYGQRFLDVAEAFHTVWVKGLLCKLSGTSDFTL
jgi:hypothetical protein